MEIQLKLYGSSKLLSENELLKLELPENSNVEQLRNSLKKLISEKHSQSNLGELSKTASFFSENDEVIDDNYRLKNKELVSIIPPIGGG